MASEIETKNRTFDVGFEIRPEITITGRFLLKFSCDSCGNSGGIVTSSPDLALYCTHCVYEDNVKQKLNLTTIQLAGRNG